jgi:cysteine synthase A
MNSVASKQSDLIGNTPLLRINSLSDLTGCDIYLKCEHLNPGGSIKDRAAKQMVDDAIAAGKLKPGMTIVEGTAGNTGIGLAVVAKSYGLNMLAVMPRGQAQEKERMLGLFGADLKLVDPCPFANENHFYHTARRLGEENKDYWWADQFENVSNMRGHYLHTAPEIHDQLNGDIDYLVSVAGTGGTVGGNSKFLKEKISKLQVHLIDPDGSGLFSFIKSGEFKSNGSSFTEGIGIMRRTANFGEAVVDNVFNLHDQDVVSISRFVRDRDGILLGSSAALNVAGALLTAVQAGKGKKIVTFLCDLGERSYSKLYNDEFLVGRELNPAGEPIEAIIERYKSI